MRLWGPCTWVEVKDRVMAKSRSFLIQRAGKGHLGRSLVEVGSQSPLRPTGC